MPSRHDIYQEGNREGGFTVHESERGWIVTMMTRWQGGRDGARYLVRYGTHGLERGADLTAPWNNIYTNGGIINSWAYNYAHRIRRPRYHWEKPDDSIRCLDRGTLVQ